MKKAYDQGTLMMLGDVEARIGCEAAMPKDHKNEWLQNRFSLKPAGRIQIPGRKGTHLVWREADVEKARRMWEEAQPNAETTKGANETHQKTMEIRFLREIEDPLVSEWMEMAAQEPGWNKNPDNRKKVARSMINLASRLLTYAQAVLGVPA